jgi:hypothetical protein
VLFDSLRRPAPRTIPKIALPVNPVLRQWDPHVPKPRFADVRHASSLRCYRKTSVVLHARFSREGL